MIVYFDICFIKIHIKIDVIIDVLCYHIMQKEEFEMTTLALKEQRINILLDKAVVNRLKQLAAEKKVPSMSKFCQEAITEKLYEFEKEQKIKMMQFAASDPDYLERCNTIQKEFETIEYNGGSEEW